MSLEGEALLAGGCIPETNSMVLTRRGHCSPIGRKGHPVDGVLMHARRLKESVARGDIPELNGRTRAHRSQALAIGRKRQGEGPPGLGAAGTAQELAVPLTGDSVPDRD